MLYIKYKLLKCVCEEKKKNSHFYENQIKCVVKT